MSLERDIETSFDLVVILVLAVGSFEPLLKNKPAIRLAPLC
jgi:hypothetical protein